MLPLGTGRRGPRCGRGGVMAAFASAGVESANSPTHSSGRAGSNEWCAPPKQVLHAANNVHVPLHVVFRRFDADPR